MDNPDKSNREWFEKIVSHERELRKQSEKSVREALRIQAEELSRRLDILNGHQQTLADEREHFVHRQAYEEWRTIIDKWISSQMGRERGVALVWAVAWVVIGALLAVAGLVISLDR